MTSNSHPPDPNLPTSPGAGTSLPQEASLSPLAVDGEDKLGNGSSPVENRRTASIASPARSSKPAAEIPYDRGTNRRLTTYGFVLGALALMLLGGVINNPLLGLVGAAIALLLCVNLLWLPVQRFIWQWATEPESAVFFAIVAGFVALVGLFSSLGFYRWLANRFSDLDWNAVGALGEVFGALGQILIAILAVYIAWRQYVIEKDLTTQQNLITQQQTIDSYFQGISELVLDEEGLLEDWPQERAIAEGRTAAILSSVDADGKAKVIRFLSRARLLTPLRRDQRVGRAILDGKGGYEEDRDMGVRVIDLGVMLAGANLADTDLRWTDLSEINLIRANLSGADLVKVNFSRSILSYVNLRGADLQGARFFYGRAEDASPRCRTELPNFRTGEHTGAVIENSDFTGATDMSPEQRYYCCAWGGSKTRATIPGGCEGIPNKLGR